MQKDPSEFTVYEVPREIIIIEPPINLVTHPISEARRQCVQPYYKHIKGCPNFGVKETCPHKSDQMHILEKYDPFSLHILLLKFDFDYYISNKRSIHPDWTNRQLANQRHWQGHLSSQLNQYWANIGSNEYPGYCLELNPEAHGVNVVETLANEGHNLEWCIEGEKHEFVSLPPNMYHVFLFGKLNDDVLR